MAHAVVKVATGVALTPTIERGAALGVGLGVTLGVGVDETMVVLPVGAGWLPPQAAMGRGSANAARTVHDIFMFKCPLPDKNRVWIIERCC